MFELIEIVMIEGFASGSYNVKLGRAVHSCSNDSSVSG